MSSTLMSKEELRRYLGLSDSTIYRMEKEGTFPKRRKLSSRRVGWLRTDVDSWAESRPTC